MIETPIKPQFPPSSMPLKIVWVNILSGAAVIERPDFTHWKKKIRQINFQFQFQGCDVCVSCFFLGWRDNFFLLSIISWAYEGFCLHVGLFGLRPFRWVPKMQESCPRRQSRSSHVDYNLNYLDYIVWNQHDVNRITHCALSSNKIQKFIIMILNSAFFYEIISTTPIV